MRRSIMLVFIVAMAASLNAAQRPDPDYWVAAMRQTHAMFTGRAGTFAHFGDSITVTLAFWTPLLYTRNNAPPEMQQAFDRVKPYLYEPCWRQWKGPKFGNEGRMTIRWAHTNIDDWLKRLNPEVALIMFGTNDLNSVPRDEYEAKTIDVVRKCLDNGTVVILSTIPPRHGFAEKSGEYAQVVRQVARRLKVPLIDFHAEVLKRRPDDWDGAMEKFSAYDGYDVPTLLARDGVHPSHPKKYQDDYSPQGLRCCGFVLRNYLTLIKYDEVLTKLGLVAPAKQAAGQTVSAEPAVQDLIRQDWFAEAPPMPTPTGPVVRVADVRQLIEAIENAQPDQTILVEDGHYLMPRYVAIRTDRVTLRSASGNRDRVVIDGAQSRHGELIGFSGCSGVTVADLTIQNIRHNGFKINSDANVQALTIRNCVIHNIWQRGVKSVKVPRQNRPAYCPTNCRVQYCLFYNDRPKRLEDDDDDIASGNYVGGIDIMYAHDWIISDNVFVGIQGRTREARGAIFVWHTSRNCLIERNVIIDCDAGICLGNPHRDQETTVHCIDVIVRNNFVTRCPEGGIVPVYTKDCRILHNSIFEQPSKLHRLIRLVFDNDGLVVANNLLCGPDIRNESDSRVTFNANPSADFTDVFVDPSVGNLHLGRPAEALIGRGVPLPDVTEDIDGETRGDKPDVGADQLSRQRAG